MAIAEEPSVCCPSSTSLTPLGTSQPSVPGILQGGQPLLTPQLCSLLAVIPPLEVGQSKSPPQSLTTLETVLPSICLLRGECDGCVVRDRFMQTLPFEIEHVHFQEKVLTR